MKAAIGNLFTSVKGHKAPQVSHKPFTGAHRYIQIEDLRPYNEWQYAKDNKGVLASEKDILIAWDGANAGTVGWGLKGYAGSTIAILKPVSDKIHTPFFGFFLYSKFDLLQANCTGATIPHINRNYLERLEVNYPTFLEQKHIATILEKADRLRRLRRYALELSDTYLQSVFMKMFGGLLHGHDSCELGEVITSGPTNGLYKPETFIGSGVLFFDIKGLYDGFTANFGYSRRIRVTEKELKQYALVSGDILINRVSKLASGVGKAVLVEKVPEPSVYESNMMRFRINKTKIAPWYLIYFLASEMSRRELLSKANITSQASINQDAVRSLRLVIPPTDLQDIFVEVVKKTNRLHIQQLEALREAEHLFKTLLYKAFRGELTEI